MTFKEKPEELDKYRHIIIVTLDYLIENYTGFLVFDDYDAGKEYYLQEKNQVEKYYEQRRLDRIKSKLAKLTQNLYFRRDINYQNHIKEQTGYSIDLYDDLHLKINQIIQKGKISDADEFRDVHFMNQIREKEANKSFDTNHLNDLIDKYKEDIFSQTGHFRIDFQKELTEDDVVEKKIFMVNNKQLTEEAYDKLRKDQGLLYKVNSPNRKNWIELQSNGKNECALTYIVIGVDGGSGSIYCVKGENLPIKAYWIDDSTILIETKKYETLNRYQKVSTKNTVINIKYIDN
ncbi:hypothetical protein DU508_21980 [Pedobacter chinensis]|uniref:Uncharacterized protein n=1 Tax=Pedobacter chinensis TaxID=2282421 RepID=A0A369PQ27_9SPHI|nr:hypothetical protein [Pedobacter chinensis]RDC54392.1 hypothetical protein DU508_21980 [Pedobacter chinensis]